MSWSDAPNWLVAVFTGLTLLIAWKGFRRLERTEGPAVFAELERTDIGLQMAVTIRNRASHPTKISKIAVGPWWRVRMAPVELVFDGVGGGQATFDKSRAGPAHEFEINLGSVEKGHATATRSFVLIPLLFADLPRQVDVLVTHEAEDGTKLKSVHYPLRVSKVLRRRGPHK